MMPKEFCVYLPQNMRSSSRQPPLRVSSDHLTVHLFRAFVLLLGCCLLLVQRPTVEECPAALSNLHFYCQRIAPF